MHSSKMLFSVPLIIESVLLCFTVLISGNVIPATFSDRWIPTQQEKIKSPPLETPVTGSVQSYTAYYHQPVFTNNVRLKSSNIKNHEHPPGALDQVHSKTSHIDHIEPGILPEPKPRREDAFQEKLGFGMLSSLLPTSILSTPQQNNDGENQIDADQNFGYSQENKGQQQFSFQVGQQIGQDNSIIMPYDDSSSEQFASNSENIQENENSENGLFSRIRNAIPFGSGLLSGLLSNENSNSNDETGVQYGYADSSSSYNKMPALTNDFNGGQPNFTSLLAFNPAHASLPNQEDSSDSNASESAESGINFLPSLPNPIESIKNLLSSILPSSDESNEQHSPESAGGIPFSGDLSSLPSGQISLANPQDSSSSETNDPTLFQNNYLSSFSNPIDTLRNLISRLNGTPPIASTASSGSEGGYINAPITEDSVLTPLQSLTDGAGLSGPLGLVVPYISYLFKALGLVKAKLPLVKLLGAVFGPILSAAIAAMVVGIVYVAIYISAAALRNEDVEGEVFLLSLKQLMDILGIPDPLEDLFDIIIGRSLQERSIKSLTLAPNHPLNTTNENYQCMERIACHAIGKKLLGVKPSWKNGWFGKGIQWITGNLNLNDWDMMDEKKSDSYFSYLSTGKSLIDAINIGMEPHKQYGNNDTSNITDNISVCATRYACDPIMFLRQIL